MFNLVHSSVVFSNLLRAMQNSFLGLEFACREQENQTLPSKPHGIARRPFQDICHFSFVLVILLTGDHFFFFWCYLQPPIADLHDNIIWC